MLYQYSQWVPAQIEIENPAQGPEVPASYLHTCGRLNYHSAGPYTLHQGLPVPFTENFMKGVSFKGEFNTIDRFISVS